jgi:DNA-binding beta-propeller fold protein YncE
MRNKVTTCGYFIKRLRDNGYTVNRIFSDYSSLDSRRWTIMVDPDGAALYITCYVNYDWSGDFKFELNDGSRFKSLQLKTDSMEVIMTKLIEKDILPSEKKRDKT